MKGAGALLAAGIGSRYCGPTHKLLANLDGEAIVRRAARSMVNSGLTDLLVVTGSAPVEAVLASWPQLEMLHNPDYEEGISTSLRTATNWAERGGFDALVVGLGDQPGVLSTAWRSVAASSSPIAVATYGGRAGNPVRLASSVWPMLPDSGDEGARVLMRTRPELVERVACEGSPDDVDTVEDLGRWS